MGESDLIVLVLSASPVVQAVMILLLIMSVMAWAIAFERSYSLDRSRKHLAKYEEMFWSVEDLGHLYQSSYNSETKPKGAERIFVNAFTEYQKLHDNIELSKSDLLNAVERNMRITYTQESDNLEQRLSILATIGSSAPYIGLFGTVWGVMHAFQSLGDVQNATLATVAPGISEALIATAIGLFAAIPAVIAYNRLSTKADRLQNRYANFAESVLIALQRNDRIKLMQPSNQVRAVKMSQN